MSDATIASLTFALIFGGALLGLFLRSKLPAHHLSQDSKDIVKVAMALVSTMSALLLGLLVASAKTAYDSEKTEVTQMTAKIVYLDRVLASYGPEAAKARALLRGTAQRALERMWPDGNSQPARIDPGEADAAGLQRAIHQLAPQKDLQQSLKSHAFEIAAELGQLRWLMFEQAQMSVSMALLIAVIIWLTIIFISFGLFAPANGTVVAALLLAAMSVSGAVYLILELDEPFDGALHISSGPMRSVVTRLGK